MSGEQRPGGAVDALRRALEAGQAAQRAADAILGVTWSGPDAHRMPGAIEALRQAGYVVHAPGEVCGIVPGARRTDPSTSAKAAERALPRAKTIAFLLLRAYRLAEGSEVTGSTSVGGTMHVLGVRVGLDGLTADEATTVAMRLDDRPLTGAWRRISDLVAAGLLEPTELERPGLSGRDQRVHRLTPAGRKLVDERRVAVTS